MNANVRCPLALRLARSSKSRNCQHQSPIPFALAYRNILRTAGGPADRSSGAGLDWSPRLAIHRSHRLATYTSRTLLERRTMHAHPCMPIHVCLRSPLPCHRPLLRTHAYLAAAKRAYRESQVTLFVQTVSSWQYASSRQYGSIRMRSCCHRSHIVLRTLDCCRSLTLAISPRPKATAKLCAHVCINIANGSMPASTRLST